MSADAMFMKGGNLHRVCEVTLADGRNLIVEPYAIYTTRSKRRHFLWFQRGSRPGEDSGWKHQEVSSVATVKLRDESFQTRLDYNPFDSEIFPVVQYAIPTHDGRQRWAAARPTRDRSVL